MSALPESLTELVQRSHDGPERQEPEGLQWARRNVRFKRCEPSTS
jgi:hypothetical protein